MRSKGENRGPGRSRLPPHAAVANALSSMRRPIELLLLSALLVVYALVYVLDASPLYGSMNLLGPTALAAILAWSCYRIVRQSPIAVWAPLFWFRFACAVYYGFGALVPHIVNEETRQDIYSYYYFDDVLNLKVNLVYCFGILSTLAFSYLVALKLGRRKPPRPTDIEGNSASQTQLFALCFLVVGGILRYGFAVPYSFGLTSTVLPGAVVTLSSMYYVGIYLLIVYGIGFNRAVMPLAWLLIGFDIIVSISSFAKTELLLILIFSFLGFISREANKTRMALGALCVAIAYFAFQPLVMHGREELAMRYGEIRGAGLGERWDIVQDYLDGSRGASASDDKQLGLLRLSYVNVDAFVMARYDAGLSGTTLRDAAAVFIPRVLWPDKPIITRLGGDLYFLVRGRDGSAMGVGHFAEAYWNFGWSGIVPFMAVLALILSVFTRVSMRVMAYRNWLFLPVVFIGVNLGLRVDGHFVPDVLGASWMAVCLGLALMAVSFVAGTRSRRKPRFLQRQSRFREAA